MTWTLRCHQELRCEVEASSQEERTEKDRKAVGQNLLSAYTPGRQKKRKLSEENGEKRYRKRSRGVQGQKQPRIQPGHSTLIPGERAQITHSPCPHHSPCTCPLCSCCQREPRCKPNLNRTKHMMVGQKERQEASEGCGVQT